MAKNEDGFDKLTNHERWLTNYESLKQWTLEHGHFSNRAKVEGRGLLNWYKYNAKLIKQGKLSAEREQMIHDLEDMRNGGHTGGRKKNHTTSSGTDAPTQPIELLLDF